MSQLPDPFTEMIKHEFARRLKKVSYSPVWQEEEVEELLKLAGMDYVLSSTPGLREMEEKLG